MNWFRDKERPTVKKPREISMLMLSASRHESYIESADDPGCYKKRVYWTARVHDDFRMMRENPLSINGEGKTRAEAVVAVIEALLDITEASDEE